MKADDAHHYLIHRQLISHPQRPRRGQGQGLGQGQGGRGGRISTYQTIYFVKAHDTHHHLTHRQGGQGQGG